jgi:6 kDa early secretory antigenic target
VTDHDLHVGPGKLRGLASDLRGESAKITGALENLDGEMSTLRAGWSGAAQQQYDIASADWTKTITHMNAVLERIATGTESTAAAFEKADAAASSPFRSAR